MSFLIASLLGGLLLYYTEAQRPVTVMKPDHHTVVITSVSNDSANTLFGEPKTEIHAIINPVQQQGETFIDSLFTAVSALCVTGLTSTDFSQFTLAGQIIVLILIQAGGLGIIVFTSLFAFAVARRLSEHVSFRTLLAQIMDTTHHDVKDMLTYVFTYTLIFEGAGALIMGSYLQWFADPTLINGINPWWWGLFHSISAFNNAGFGLLNNNLMNFTTDPVINLTVALLIILGGLGYPVLIFIYAYIRGTFFHHQDIRQRMLQQDIAGIASKVQVIVAIFGTMLLLVIGTIIPLVVEWGNGALSGMSFLDKLLIMFFQSTSTRTAGFNTIDIGALHVASLFLYMFLMYVGANPAGTAGGIKIPTVAVLYGYIVDWFKAPNQPVTLRGRRISKFALSHAIRLFFFSTVFIGVITFLISVFERDFLITPDPLFNFMKVMFEVFSAFGTVGMSMGFAGGVTSFSAILSDVSKVLIIITMLFGRLGPLTILASLPWKREHLQAPPSKDHTDVESIQIG